MHRSFIYLEILLYAGAVLLSAGALDFMMRIAPSTGVLRAGLWGVTYLGFAALFAIYPAVLMQALRTGWPLLIWPAMALTSWLWSADSGATLKAGLQLLSITLFGMFMGARLGMAGLTRLIFAVLAVTAVLSLLVIGLGDVALDHHHNLIGAFSHKNVTGNRMGLLILAAAVLVAAGQWRLLAVLVLFLATAVLFLSGSATALVATVGCLFGLTLLYCWELPGQMRVLGLSLVTLAGAGVVFIAYLMQVNLPEAVLEMMGKDATLTGRATLWEFAFRSIEEKPWFGYGYEAFWTGDRFDSEWLRWVMEQRLAHFHNGFLDIGVQLGLPGMAALIGVLLLFLWKAIRYTRVDGSAFGWMPLLVLALIVVSNTAEVIVFIRHGFLQFIMCAVYVRMAIALSASSAASHAVTWAPARMGTARLRAPRMQEAGVQEGGG